jgi:hypothetical protein
VAILADHEDLWPLTRRRFAFRCPFHLCIPIVGRFPTWPTEKSAGRRRSSRRA